MDLYHLRRNLPNTQKKVCLKQIAMFKANF